MRMIVMASGKIESISNGNFPTYPTGLEVSKPTSPSVGDHCTATDTGKTYIRFVNGVWGLVSSPAAEE
jgi:hypothetical protein